MKSAPKNETTQERLLRELRHHFKGWLKKVAKDLSEEEFKKEVASLESDKVYSSFGLDCPEYALVRIMGRVSISIGRRLGEIYDKMPRFIAQARFGLSAEQVAPKIDKRLQLDVCIPYDSLSGADRAAAIATVDKHVKPEEIGSGAAIASALRKSYPVALVKSYPHREHDLAQSKGESSDIIHAGGVIPSWGGLDWVGWGKVSSHAAGVAAACALRAASG